MALFSPSKIVGARLSQLATSFAPMTAPDKLMGDPMTSFAPSEPSYTPAKMVNANAGSDPSSGAFAIGGPPKLGPGDLLGAFPAPAATTPSQPVTGGVPTVGGDWAGVEQWNGDIAAAAAKYGVPVNLIKAVMKLESNGDPDAAGADGVWGPMQVYSGAWGDGPWMHDPHANIDKGVQILKSYYDQYGDWGTALQGYHGFGSDGYTTDTQYRDIVQGNWDTLNNASGTAGSGYTAPPSTGAFTSIWGNANAPITQDFGWTDFARTSDYARTAYDYTSAYTRDRQPMGHAGVDVGVGYGTALYAPTGGVVQIAGGSGYYCDSDQGKCGPGSGELLIQYANGDQLILGHMGNITVGVGQTIQPGQYVGTSGGENGAHVHVEYRKWVGQGVTDSGYEVIDPRQAMGGIGGVAPSYGQGYAAPTVTTQPGSYASGLRQWSQQYGR